MDEHVAFEDFVQHSSAAFLKTGWLLTGDWHLAQDLVQTALAKTWPQWSRIRNPEAAGAYVRKAMLRTFLSWRSRRWSGEVPSSTLPIDTATADFSGGADTRQVVRAALGRLSRQQRAVVVCRYFLDLSEAEVASAMDCSVPTVKTHSSRALARLRSDSQMRNLTEDEVGNGRA